MPTEKSMVLKHNIVLLITTQEELNQFAELEDVPKDALHIDQEYVAFRDDLGAIQLIPRAETLEGYPLEFDKPTLFRRWYNRNRKKENAKM